MPVEGADRAWDFVGDLARKVVPFACLGHDYKFANLEGCAVTGRQVGDDATALRGVLLRFQDEDEFVDRFADSGRFGVEDTVGSCAARNARLQEPKDVGGGKLCVLALQRLGKALGKPSI